MLRTFFALAALALFPTCLFGQYITVDNFQALTYNDGQGHTLPYRLWVPANYNAANHYPLVLFFHGAGGAGTDNRGQLTDQAAPLVFVQPQNQARWPCFMIAPQCPSGQAGNAGTWSGLDWTATSNTQLANPTWPMAAAMAVVDLISSQYSIDTTRLYITGISMGGGGTVDAITRFPTKFAKAVPIHCWGDDTKGSRIANLPLWTFHSADDPTINVNRTRNMIAAIRAAGGHPYYTEFCSNGLPCYGHAAWVPAYAEPELLPWIFGAPIAGVHGGDGLAGKYFPNTTLTGNPTYLHVDGTIDINWGTGSPDSTLPADSFSAQWTGTVVPDHTETYTFYTKGDDQMSVTVNGVQLTALGGAAGVEESGSIALTANQAYNIVVKYVETGGGAYATLQWSSPSTPKQIIPMDNLFSGVPAAPAYVTATPGNGKVIVTWSTVPGATSYTVKQGPDIVGHYQAIASNVTATNYIQTGLTNGTAYFYAVSASNANGQSVNSVHVTATPSTTPTQVFQTESLALVSSSGDTHRVVVDSRFSNGAGTILDADAASDFVVYDVPGLVAGNYDFRVGMKNYPTRGIWQNSIAPLGSNTFVNHGPPVDEYNAGELFGEVDLGTLSLGSNSDKAFKFTITGKNAASTGFSMSFDYIKLIPQ